MTGRVEGKVAFITGAARGQGRAHAVRLAQEGADIIAIDCCQQIVTVPYPLATSDDLAETANMVRALGRRIVTSEVDVRDYEAMKAAVDSGVGQFGRLDIIVANAAINSVNGPLATMNDVDWQDVVDVNLTGLWKSAKAGIPHLIAGSRGGSIVLACSAAGLKAYPYIGNYVAAKHGVVGIMRTLAVELAQHLIRVNSVHPTQVNTPMLMNDYGYRVFRPDLPSPGADDIAPISQTMNTLPIPWVEPEDVANAVLFLASDESRYITGVALPVDAGALLK